MPGPDQWTPQDFTEATSLLAGDKLTDVQRSRLQDAVGRYQQTSGSLGVTASAGPKAADLQASLAQKSTAVQPQPNVSRETDPFAQFDAQTKAMVGEAPKPPPPGQEPPGMLETVGNNAMNGAFLGMGDAAGAYDAASALGMDPTVAGPQITQQAKARRLAGNADHPLAAGAAEFAGTMLSPANIALGGLGGAAGRAVGAVGKLGRALEIGGAGALSGGAQGAAMAPEGHALAGGAVGAGLGAAMGPLAAYVGDPIAGFVGKQASNLRLRSTGATPGDVKGMVMAKGPGAVDTLAQTLEGEGLTAGTGSGPAGSGPATSEGLLSKAQQVIAEEGPKIRALSEQAQGSVNVGSVGVELAQRAAQFHATRLPEGDRIAKKLMENALPLIRHPERGFENALQTRRVLDNLVQKAGQGGELDNAFARAMTPAIAKMHEAIDTAAQAEGPEFHAALTQANKRFSAAKYQEDWAAGGVGKTVAGSESTGHTRWFPGVLQQTNAAMAPTMRATSQVMTKVPELAPQMGSSLFDRFFVPRDDQGQ